jgi:tetratricopeptide (TPR) repeat protein
MHSQRGPFRSQGNSTGDSFLNIRFKLLLLLLLAMPKLGLGQQDQDTAFESLVTVAQKAQAANDFAASANSYKQAVKLRQDIPELWANLGLMQHESQDYAGAVQSFRQALRLKPSLYVPQLFLGVDYMRMGNAEEAIPHLLKAEAMNDKDSLPSLTLGRSYSSQGKFSLAARAYEHAIHLDSKKSSAWFGLGIARLDQVEEDARRVTAEDQSSPYAKTLYAESLVKQARYNEAAGIYKSVLTAKSQPPCIQAELGFLLLKQRDAVGAEAGFQAERQTDPGCSLAILGQARLQLDAGSNEDALKLLKDLWARDRGFFTSSASALTDSVDQARASSFQQFLANQSSVGALAPDLSSFLSSLFNGQSSQLQSPLPSSDVMRHTAQEDYSSGRYAQCASRSKDSLKTKNVVSLQMLAMCAYFTGDYDLASNASEELAAVTPHSLAALYWSIKANERMAFSALEEFQQIEPNSSRTHLLLGDIYRQRTRFEDARVEYQNALAITPNDPAALIGLASAYFGNGNIEKTRETAQLALNQTPDDPELNLLMAEALLSIYRFDDAEPFLLKALNAKPQMLPHVHALLGEVYGHDGKTQQAIDQILLGIQTDEDGSLHYQLARLYRKIGDTKAAATAIEQLKAIEQQRREQAGIANRDSHPSALDDGP